MNQNMVINRLPVPTWNRLRLNDAVLDDVPELAEGVMTEEVPDGIIASRSSKPVYTGTPTGAGSATTDMLLQAEAPACRYLAPAGYTSQSPVRLSFSYEQDARSINAVELTAEEGSYLWVVEDFATASEDVRGFACVQTRIRAGRGARVRLVQVHRMNDRIRFINDIGTDTDDSASVEVIQLVLGGGQTWLGLSSDLNGVQAHLSLDTAYMVRGDSRLDMNYIVNHIGRKSTSEINANGVLRDRAFKLFRGTIDLRNGACGAVGNEMENVLLMDDGVVNQTIPLILCDEEDVEGNHGATIGKLDDDLMFYMESRGISREAIYEMMSTAHVEALLSRIEDTAVTESVHAFLRGGAANED